MALRRLHWTDRRRIPAKGLSISLDEDGHSPAATVDMSRDDLEGFPDHAVVIGEFFRRPYLERKEFGDVRTVKLPFTQSLQPFGEAEGVRFRLKIVETSEGKRGQLIGVSSSILLEERSGNGRSRSLLPVVPMNLGDLIYKLQFGEEPELQINEKFYDFRSVATHKLFVGFVVPHLLEGILTYIMLGPEADYDEELEDTEDWRTRWLRFARGLRTNSGLPSPDADHQEKQEWIDEVIASFCRRHSMLRKVKTSLEGSDV